MYLKIGHYITVAQNETLTHFSYELMLIFFLMRLSPVFNLLPELGRLIHSRYFIVLCDVDPCIYPNSKGHLKINNTPRNVDTDSLIFFFFFMLVKTIGRYMMLLKFLIPWLKTIFMRPWEYLFLYNCFLGLSNLQFFTQIYWRSLLQRTYP